MTGLAAKPAVNAAVERFYVRVLADPMLAPFFTDVNMERLKGHQFAFLSQALGGPQQYSGATMSASARAIEDRAAPLRRSGRAFGRDVARIGGQRKTSSRK